MKSNVSESHFIDQMASEIHGFDYKGARLLFEYLEQLEDGMDEEIKFDPVAFRCDFTQFNIQEYINDYKEIEEKYNEYCNDNDLNVLDSESYVQFFDDELDGQDENICIGESDCFIVRAY